MRRPYREKRIAKGYTTQHTGATRLQRRAWDDFTGVWFWLHSRSASLIRVRLPRPAALKWASTSCDSRMVVDTFGVVTAGQSCVKFAVK